MDLKERMELLKTKNSEINELKNQAFDLSRSVFEDWCKDVFVKHPKLESFGWNQYTPYFNDGDTCIFSANTDYIKVNDEYVDDAEWSSETNVTSWGIYNRETKTYEGRVEVPNEKYDKELDLATFEIRSFLANFDDDFYLRRFGDHTEVTVTNEGIEVDDYDHD
jgi:hypothetical protein